MSRNRQAARVDYNQPDIVKDLRSTPGVTVELNHDDIIVGYKGVTYWYEIKTPECVGKDGKIQPSKLQPSQKTLLKEFTGHYKVVWCTDQILKDLGIVKLK